jgi:hypothetical protein
MRLTWKAEPRLPSTIPHGSWPVLTRLRRIGDWKLAATLLGLACLAPVARLVAPWHDAAPTPVEIRMAAPGNSKIFIAWRIDRQERTALIPAAVDDKGQAEVWLGELPPRPDYDLSLCFDAPVQGRLSEITLHNVRGKPIFQLKKPSLNDCFVDNLDVTASDRALSIACGDSGRLSLKRPISVSHRPVTTFLRTWAALAAAFLVAGIVIVGIVRRPALERPGTVAPAARSLWPIWAAFTVGGTFHVLCTACMPPLYNAFDPLIYFEKAVSILGRGTYRTDMWEVEIDRLPGYPVFLAACFKLFGRDLLSVTLAQAALFAVATLCLALSLRRWLSSWLGAVLALVSLVNPMNLHSNRVIGTEGLFTSLVALSLAAFFQAIVSDPRGRRRWLTLFALVGTAAIFVRPNGIIVFVAPLFHLLRQVVAALRLPVHWRRRGASALAECVAWSWPAAVAGLALFGWSWRNYHEHQVFAPTAMVGVSLVEGRMQAGIFNAQSLTDEALREWYVRDKFALHFTYNAWHFRRSVYLLVSDFGTNIAPDFLPQFEKRMIDVAERSDQRTCWQLRLVALQRTAYWGLALPNEQTYGGYSFQPEYEVIHNNANDEQGWQRFGEMQAPPYRGMTDGEYSKPSWALGSIGRLNQHYLRYYDLMLGAGILSGLGLLWRRPGPQAMPFLIFLANLALNCWLLNVHRRYIQTLEILLVTQTLLGVQFLTSSIRQLPAVHASSTCVKALGARIFAIAKQMTVGRPR